MRIDIDRTAAHLEPINRPALARFLWERGLTFRDAAAPLQRSHEYVRRLCLPFDDPKRCVPSEDDLAHIERWTGGQIGAADFVRPVDGSVLRLGRSS